MLLVIDAGNTNTVLGIYEGEELVRSWRIRTERNTTEDEFCILVKSLFADSSVDFRKIEKTVISSVVPPVMGILDSFCRKHLNHAPVWVNAKNSGGLSILYNNPDEVGADRIVNAVAAYRRYKTYLIVIDFGTATTFDVVTAKGEYLGGAITPGIMIAAEALFQRTSKLPRVELFEPPSSVIGKDTPGSMKSGIILGYASLVDGMVAKISRELGKNFKVVATGGLAELMTKVSETIEAVDGNLTLEGLRIIGETS
jgi:type III pantothenate kinase